MTYCSSICRISTLRLLMSRSFRCLARRGLSSNNSSSNSCDASKFAFLDYRAAVSNLEEIEGRRGARLG